MGTEIRTTDDGLRHRRDLAVNGHVVSHLTVLDRSTWMLGATVSFGGIAGVHTEPQHRMKGYSRLVMEDSVQYMTDRGFEVSILFGIRDFYNKFGYLPCLPDYCMTIETRNAERAARDVGGFTTRPFDEADVPFSVELYDEDNRYRPGARVRGGSDFNGFHRGTRYDTPVDGLVLQGADNRRVGYAIWDRSTTDVKVVEVNAYDRRAFPAALYAFARMAIDQRCGQIELHMPPDHSFARFLTRYGCQAHTTFNRMGGGMMRILNQDRLFARLQPALQARAASSALAGRGVDLRIETDLGTTEVALGESATDRSVCRVALPQDRLIQLMTGYRWADDVLATEDGVEAEGEASAVLSALFGGILPFTWKADRF